MQHVQIFCPQASFYSMSSMLVLLCGRSWSTVSSDSQASPCAAAGMAKYEVMGVYGQGRTGVTKLMRNRKTSELIAAKWIAQSCHEALSKETEREICNHRRLQHPNIIGPITSYKQHCIHCGINLLNFIVLMRASASTVLKS